MDDRVPRRPQRHPPDEEAQDRRLQEVPRPALPADERQGHRRGLRGERRCSVLPPRTRLPRDRVHDGAAQAARWAAPQTRRPRQARQGSRPGALRRAEAGLGEEQDRHHDGGRAAAPRLDEGQGDRSAHRADRSRRVPHVRDGLDVPERQGLQPRRPALRVGGPQAAAQVARGDRWPAAARGHLGGRSDGIGHCRGLVVRHPRPGDDPVLHLLLDVRVPADR
jgi:hypothetical protein